MFVIGFSIAGCGKTYWLLNNSGIEAKINGTTVKSGQCVQLKDTALRSDFGKEIHIGGIGYTLVPGHYEWSGDRPVVIGDKRKIEEHEKKCRMLSTSNKPPTNNEAVSTVGDNERVPIPDASESTASAVFVPTLPPLSSEIHPITVSAVYQRLKGFINSDTEEQACMEYHKINYIEQLYTLRKVLCQKDHRKENTECLEESISWLHNRQHEGYTCKKDEYVRSRTLSCPVPFHATTYNCIKN